MARVPVLAAGGIVLRREATPLIAVVRLRKRNEWVLPKGKLDDGETPRQAAEREVREETGHDVSVHEFLGTLVYEFGGRSKVVHYWRMQTSGGPSYALMDDIRAVDWLPLEAAVERLSRSHEQAFLANVGPMALEAAALAEQEQRPKARPSAVDKRRSRRLATPQASPPLPEPEAPPSGLSSAEIAPDQRPTIASEVDDAETWLGALDFGTAALAASADAAAPEAAPQPHDQPAMTIAVGRRNLMQRMRDWLRRAA